MMRKYETIFIQHPSFDEETVKTNIEKFKGVIENGEEQSKTLISGVRENLLMKYQRLAMVTTL